MSAGRHRADGAKNLARRHDRQEPKADYRFCHKAAGGKICVGMRNHFVKFGHALMQLTAHTTDQPVTEWWKLF